MKKNARPTAQPVEQVDVGRKTRSEIVRMFLLCTCLLTCRVILDMEAFILDAYGRR